ncbi:MAG: alanine dehydrogenase [Kordiimonadales bacterium]|nr:MAG: alanine dehydrogenase [Kordiimonadales bacterium]
MTSFPAFKTIALAREVESPENPGGLEKRVALIPEDVKALIEAGLTIYVEKGAGLGVGFTDEDYMIAGAELQGPDQIYRDKDMVIKFKGPPLAAIHQMQAGTTLFCMAHFHSYPDRAQLLEDKQINVIAMEEITQSPKTESNTEIMARTAMNHALMPFYESNTVGGLRIRIIGWSKRLSPCIRRGSNRNPRSVHVVQADVRFEDLSATGDNALYIYDSAHWQDEHSILAKLTDTGAHLFDLTEFEAAQGEEAVANYRASHLPLEFGLRRIQCLHETGMAGARYGVTLLKENKPGIDVAKAKAVVLGYGNVGQGAIHELYDQGIGAVRVLGRGHTQKGMVDFWLKGADLIINGAEQPTNLRGVNFLVTNKHLEELVPDGSVVIDLVGGSPTNRSPVEAVLSCTFLTDPAFVHSGVTLSALWGWPMLGMMRETAIKYSGQIRDVLHGREVLKNGLSTLAPGVERALVCGKFPLSR